MPPNPHAPGSAGTPDSQVDVSAEMERRKAEMLEEVITGIRVITIEQHDKLAKLLGEKAPDAMKAKNPNWYTRNIAKGTIDLAAEKPEIVRILASTEGALSHLLPDYFKEKSIMIGGLERDLRDIILDPTSDDAKWLTFVYNKFGGSSNPEWQAILVPSTFDPDHAKKLKELDALRSEYGALQADTSFHNLDRKQADLVAKKTRYEQQLATLTTPATPPSVGSGSTYVNVNTGAGNADPTAQIEKLNKLIDDLDSQDSAIDMKKTELDNRLKSIDKRGHDINIPAGSTAAYVPSSIDPAILGNFSATTQPSAVAGTSSTSFAWARDKVDIDGTEHTIEEWVTKPEAASDITKLKAKSKRGTAKISAGTALDQMLRTHFAAREPGASEAELDAMVKQMRSALSKRYEEKKPEEKKDEKDAKQKKDGGKKWGSWLGSAWGSFAGYMLERDKTLLGFPVDSKD